MLRKKNFTFIILIMGSLLFSLLGFNSTEKIKSSIVTNWKMGTSVHDIKRLTEEKLEQLKSAGFTDIEVEVGRIRSKEDLDTLKSQIKMVRELVEKKNINIWSIHIPYGKDIDISLINDSQREQVMKEVTLLMAECENLKPEKLVIHPSYEPIPDEERAERLKACKASLRVLVQRAKEYNTQLTIECLPRTCLGNTGNEVQSIVNEVKGLGVCCDVNHLLQESPEEFIKTVGSNVVTLHISDYDGIDERHWLPGQGVINWNNVLESLVSIAYQGPFMFESKGTFEEKAQCWEKLKKDYNHSRMGE